MNVVTWNAFCSNPSPCRRRSPAKGVWQAGPQKWQTRQTLRPIRRPESDQNEPWWTFRIFFIFFFRSGEGKGESEAPGEGATIFLLKIPGGGVSRAGGGGGMRGREGVCGEFGGGGLNIFFRGRNSHQGTNDGVPFADFPVDFKNVNLFMKDFTLKFCEFAAIWLL